MENKLLDAGFVQCDNFTYRQSLMYLTTVGHIIENMSDGSKNDIFVSIVTSLFHEKSYGSIIIEDITRRTAYCGKIRNLKKIKDIVDFNSPMLILEGIAGET